MKKTLSRILVIAALSCSAFAAHAANLIYDSYVDKVFSGSILRSDTYVCRLVTAAYTASKGTHQNFSDVTNEVVGTGYTAGGKTVVPTFALNTTAHTLTITIPALSWPSATLVARGAVCGKSTGTDATSPLLVYDDFGADISTTAGTFNVNAISYTINIP